jgi:hypothetical protein
VKPASILPRCASASVVAVFAFNVYIALYDKTLSRLNSLHYSFNWIIVIIDFAAAVMLIVRPRSVIWVSLGGIVWPLIYISFLFVDFETLLCLGTNISCWPSVRDAYDYLILGSRVEGWVLWPYTIRVVISLLVVTVVLAAFSLLLSKRGSTMVKKKDTGNENNQDWKLVDAEAGLKRSDSTYFLFILAPYFSSRMGQLKSLWTMKMTKWPNLE